MQLPGGKEVPGVVIAVSLLIIGAGAAAGAATGTISGDSTTEVEAALEVDDVTVNGGNGFGVIGDQNASFVTTAEIFQGDEYTVDLNLDNQGSDNITAKLVFKNTDPLHVDITNSGSDISVGQVGSNEYILDVGELDDSADGELTITVESGNAINPGFFEFETEIVPVEVDG